MTHDYIYRGTVYFRIQTGRNPCRTIPVAKCLAAGMYDIHTCISVTVDYFMFDVCRYIYIYTVYACHAQPTCSQSRCSRYLDRPQLLAEAMAGGMVVGSSPCWCLQFFQMVPRFINDMGFSSDSI